MKGLLGFLAFSCLIAIGFASGEFSIHHSPNGVNFKGNEPVESSELPNILSAAMGFSSKSDNSWEGLTISNPFNYPKMTVIAEIEGLTSMKLSEISFPLRTNINLQLVKEILSLSTGNMLEESNFMEAGTPDDSKLEKLNPEDKVASEFFSELQMLKNLKEQIATKKQSTTVWIHLKGLNKIIREYGQYSEQSLEAGNLLTNAIEQLETSLTKVYGEQFMLASITVNNQHSRRVRQATKDDKLNINLSKKYDEEYSAIFNIILWTSIFLIAALISTSIFICTLDPGRDSIIYRMTTQRIKKDN